MASERRRAKERPKSDPGPTGRELPARTPGKNPATGEPQGELVRHPKGSNGDVHRGPDLKPRLFIPSVLIMAFTEEGELAHREPYKQRSGAQKRKRARARHAATLNAAIYVKRIMLDAAEGDNEAGQQAIRILGLTHETLQPTPHEAAKGSQGPIVPRFKRYEAPDAEPAASAPAYPEPPGTKLVDKDGTEYVEGPPPEG